MKKILFLEENFSMQGSTKALIDYAYYNKKILKNESIIGKGYVEILKNDAIYYDNNNDLLDIFLNFSPEKNKDYNSYQEFSPINVMKQFDDVFLKNL